MNDSPSPSKTTAILRKTWPALAGFMALLAVVNISTLLNERLLDWEEFRILPTAPQSFESIHQRDPTLEFSECANLWFWSNHFLGIIEALRILSMAAGFGALALAGLLGARLAGKAQVSIAVLFVLGMNAYFTEFSRWGISYYILGVAYSICMLYLFHRIHAGTVTRGVRILLVLGSFAGVYVSQREAIFVLAAGPLAVLAGHFLCRPETRPPLRKKIVDLAFLSPFLIGFAITGWRITVANLPWLFKGGENQLHDPKLYRAYMYFWHAKGYPKTPAGFFRFYYDRTGDLFSDFFTLVGAPHANVRHALALLFAIGLIVSLICIVRRRQENRQFLAVFFLAGFAVCLALNVLNINPFGNPRYCTFLFFPVAALTALGLGDIVSAISAAFRKRSDLIEAIGYSAAGLALCTIATFAFFSESSVRIERGRDARDIMAAMRNTSDLFLVSARYRDMMAYHGPESMDRVMVLTKDTDAILKRISDPKVKRLTVISRYANAADENPDLESLLARDYTEFRSSGLYQHSDPNYVLRMFKYDINARVFIRRPKV